ncbi:G protein-regulated inducer of neurite outgrowth 1 [Chaetodon trifascialis]|uniref:G protein-regulated inducer of neurite outgrowth 1 n=1 Tax=Chaetodon trifascialis TaxID=109706 RepID=UPI003993F03A
MGSLKDEMRGVREDHKPCETADDGERSGDSQGSAVPERPEIKVSQETTSQGDYQPKPHMLASYIEERDENPVPKDQVLSGEVCDNTDSIGVKDSMQTVAIPLIQQPEADKITTATHNDTTVSYKLLSDGEGNGEIQGDTSKDEIMNHDGEKETEIENVSVPVPATPGPLDPRSPAPAGQHHMRTQVSLEVAQCRSAATSPMTPPEGNHSFFFPSSFGKSGAVGADTKDAELQVGQQVEFCSVATSPMTPKTPSTTAFPELIGREVKKREGQSRVGQQESFPVTRSPEVTGALKFTTSKELSEDFSSNATPESSASRPAAGSTDSPGTLEDSNQQCKQQRMGSMDQDITILVTHCDNNMEEEEESSFHPTEPEMVKIDEHEELGESNSDNGRENISTETVVPGSAQDTSNTNMPQNKTAEASVSAQDNVKCEKSEVKENNGTCEEPRDISTKPPVPESPAPFGCHNIRTQVSLEVVQCQSVATSPMTPPEGDHAFYFPSSFGRCAAVGAETKDAELQVGQQVEFRSVATAPMTPRTPITTTFPEIRKEASIGEKIVEEEEDIKEQVVEGKQEVGQEEEKVERKIEATEEDTTEARNCKEKGEEPVQEVSWDEKGMTWEVYGAVVEVTVLGSAIQKHLEKQVKKKQPSMPPPPPLNPSAMPLSSESTQGGSGKGRAGKRGEQDGEVSRRRRNPFRLMMKNMQQPHCCSKAHTTE